MKDAHCVSFGDVTLTRQVSQDCFPHKVGYLFY
jgi:hypothetical protein